MKSYTPNRDEATIAWEIARIRNRFNAGQSNIPGGETATVRVRNRIEAAGALELKGAPVIFNGVQAEPL